MRKQLRLAVEQIRRVAREGLGDAGVQALAGAAQQAALGGVLDEGVAEGVGRVGLAVLDGEIGGDEMGQAGAQLDLAEGGQLAHQAVGEAAADQRADLGDQAHWDGAV